MQLSTYDSFEEVAEHFTTENEGGDRTDEETLVGALAACADDKLTGFVLRLVLTEHAADPRGEQMDWLAKAEAAFAPVDAKPKKVARKPAQKVQPVPTTSPSVKGRKKAA